MVPPAPPLVVAPAAPPGAPAPPAPAIAAAPAPAVAAAPLTLFAAALGAEPPLSPALSAGSLLEQPCSAQIASSALSAHAAVRCERKPLIRFTYLPAELKNAAKLWNRRSARHRMYVRVDAMIFSLANEQPTDD
jgi:hypothetical protein